MNFPTQLMASLLRANTTSAVFWPLQLALMVMSLISPTVLQSSSMSAGSTLLTRLVNTTYGNSSG